MATDPARKQTDDLLKDLEKRIKKEYEQAAKEVQEKANSYFSRYAKQDQEKQAAVKAGKMTQDAYEQWRVRELTQGTRYKEMINDLTATAVNADKAAMKMVNDSMADVFSLNANYGAYEVEKATGIDTSFSLYNRDAVGRLLRENPDLLPKPKVNIPEDMRWNKQHMSSAILQGILQGDSIDNISKRLESVTTMDSKAAVRNARTMTTSAENAGHMHSYKRAEEMGIKGKKMWMATHDNRTRESHAMMDGETRDLDEAFSNGLMEPGDMSVDKPEEVYNCRCRIVYVSSHSRFAGDYDEENQKITIDGKTYDAWKRESYEKWLARHEGTNFKTIDSPEVVGWMDSIIGVHSRSEDVKAVNPEYGSSWGNTNNCQRCVTTYEARRRGYDVIALPAVEGESFIRGVEYLKVYEKGDRTLDRFWHMSGRTISQLGDWTKEQNLATCVDVMKSYGNGARAIIEGFWEYTLSGHVFIAENVNGVIQFYDPQTGNMNCESYFSDMRPKAMSMIRIDDLSFNDNIKEVCENAKQSDKSY